MNRLAQRLINYVHDHRARLLFNSGLWVGVTFVFWVFTWALLAR